MMLLHLSCQECLVYLVLLGLGWHAVATHCTDDGHCRIDAVAIRRLKTNIISLGQTFCFLVGYHVH